MKRRLASLLVLLAAAWAARAADVVFEPASPTLQDVVRIEVRGGTRGGVLHWGVNARGNSWEQARPCYRPAGSIEDGVATRTRLDGPDAEGVCRVTLGPFDRPEQPVRSVDFAIQWDDRTWDTRDGADYHVPVSQARIEFSPADPALNDAVTVTVRRSAPGGQLRWGVNAEHGTWRPPDPVYGPAGTVAAGDGLAVDSPLPPPDETGNSSLVLGPFNRPGQVVTSLHAAVHWGPTNWDTDLGRNYNLGISLRADMRGPSVEILGPTNGQAVADGQWVFVRAERASFVQLALDGRPVVMLTDRFKWPLPVADLACGRHELTARTLSDGLAAVQRVEFWRVPTFREEALPPGIGFGATDHGDGAATFALYAPGKRFVSLVGDFNGWNPVADVMSLAPDGTWWITRPLEPGTHLYQYVIEGSQFLADPYSRDVEWKDEEGIETHRPERARSVLTVGEPAFAWTDGGFERPPLNGLVIYELNIDDVGPGEGFTGVVARLDYIRDLGVNAIEPMPFNEFPGSWSWGYNPAFHFAPESAYGTPADLKRLVDEAHRRGLAVVMDLVLNHMEWNAPLFQLYGRDYGASPYFHEFLGENWGFPDLEQASPAFKRYVADLLKFWIEEYHVDGFRYDATRWVGWEGYNDWGASWFAYAAKQADSNTYQIAEHLPTDPDLASRTEVDAQWHDHFRWRLREMIRGAKLDRDEFERIMDPRRLGFSNSFERVAYVESHDEERLLRELADDPEEEAVRRALSALAIVLTAPGVPMVYAGQELGEATPKAVAPNPLHWAKREEPAYRPLFDGFRVLAKLRTTNPALRTEDIRFRPFTPENVAVYERGSPGAGVIVAVNFGQTEEPAAVELPARGTWRDVLRPSEAAVSGPTNLTVTLPPGGAAVFAGE